MFNWRFKRTIQGIVASAATLKNKYTSESSAPVNYACVFAHGDREYRRLIASAQKLGTVIEETTTGPLFRIPPLRTTAGRLQVLKIRAPDDTRPERGDADFTVGDFEAFKATYVGKEGFRLIRREPNIQMIELTDAGFDVRAYFSNPPIDKELGIA